MPKKKKYVTCVCVLKALPNTQFKFQNDCFYTAAYGKMLGEMSRTVLHSVPRT